MTLRIVTHLRNDWGALEPKNPLKLVNPLQRTHATFHYSTGQELGNTKTAQWVRNIQKYHQSKWSDIGYNWLFDIHGNVYEGRGTHYQGAHASNFNVQGVGICFLGNDDPDVTDLTPEAKAAAAWCLARVVMDLGHQVAVNTHRDVPGARTACPGNELRDFVYHELGSLHTPKPANEGQPPGDGNAPFVPETSKPKPAPHKEKANYLGYAWPLPRGKFFGKDSVDGTPNTSYAGRNAQDHIKNWANALGKRGWNVSKGGPYLTKYGNDGHFGDEYVKLAEAFQNNKKITKDGVVGPETWGVTNSSSTD